MALAVLAQAFVAAPVVRAQATRFQVSPAGDEVQDAATGLVWRRCAEGMSYSAALGSCTGTATTFTHEQALAHARDVAAATGVAWRVPHAKELSGIVDRSRFNPSINVVAFPNTPPSRFWSSTPSLGEVAAARYVEFFAGIQTSAAREQGNSIRLVRSGT